LSQQIDGGQAFPVADQGMHGSYGMSLRDWFAGQALSGVHVDGWLTPEDLQALSAWCYAIADAMLAERERRSKP
jgi:hypothetical protein